MKTYWRRTSACASYRPGNVTASSSVTYRPKETIPVRGAPQIGGTEQRGDAVKRGGSATKGRTVHRALPPQLSHQLRTELGDSGTS